MSWLMVQLGDNEQCINNDVEGWDYCVGINKGQLRNNHYYFSNGENISEWWTDEDYSTTFKLQLIF